MKLLYTLFLSICTIGIITANTGEFTYDAAEVNAKFEKLSKIEQIHKANPDLNFDEITSAEEFQGLNISKDSIALHGMAGDLPLLPAFWWGCILGVLGILIVYLITEDGDQTKSALWGFLIGWGVGCVLYILFWVVIFGNAWWFGG
jgi:hypothetical protein